MKIAVVIPNLNEAEMLASCVRSLQKQSLKADVIVVDNASIDESVEMLESNFPGVTLIKNPENRGFAGGVNPGIRRALENDMDAVALFNNDAVADKDWLRNLAETMKRLDAGIVTGKLMRDDRARFDSTGDYYSVYGVAFPRGRNQKDEGQYEAEEPVFGASGGASLYSVGMLKEIGVFDERFFAYFEDVDISFRARLAGWEVVYNPKAVAYHHVGATSSKMGDFTRYHSIKNFLILYTKNMPAPLYWKYMPRFLYQFARTTLRSLLDAKPHVLLKSVSSFLWLLPGVLTDRRRIQKSRGVPVEEINRWLHKSRPPKIPEL